MENNNPQPRFIIRLTIAKKDIPDFVNSLHTLQETYLDAAVEASGYREAQAELDRIMKL